MSSERRFKLLILFNVLVSMLGFGVANNSLHFIIPAIIVAVAGWWTTERRAGTESWSGLPRWLTSIIVAVMLLISGVRSWIAEDLVAGFTEFLAAVIVLKLWERRAPRDYGQLITLSLFMTVGSTLTDSGVITGAVWMIQLPLLVAAVMMFQIYAARHRAIELTSTWIPSPPPPARTAQLQRPAFVRLCACVLLIGLAVSGTVFVLIPRGSGMEEWNILRNRAARVSGFTDEIDPGAGSLISDSYTTVLEARFSGSKGNLGGLGTRFYLRGAILESYSQGKWAESSDRNAPLTTVLPDRWHPLSRTASSTTDLGDDVIEQHFTLLPGARDPVPLFALFRPIAIYVDDPSSTQQIRFDRAAGWLQREHAGKRLAQYAVRSRIPAPEPDLPERRPFPPFTVEGVRTIAAQILRSANIEPDPDKRPMQDDEKALIAFENHLRSPAFSYTRDSAVKPPLGVDPTLWFLQTRREGHCEYYASALAALCRSVGINARVVAGYLANEYDLERGVYIVRESDAHAWAEVDTGPNGWQLADATPASAARQESEETIADGFRRFTAGISDWWGLHIISFNQAQQDKLLSRFGAASLTDAAVDLYRRTAYRTRQFLRDLKSPAVAASVAGGLVLITGLTWALVRAWKRRPARIKNELGWAMKGPEHSVYKATLQLLAARGHAKPTWSPPLVHLRDVAVRDPALADRAQAIMHLLYESRFGGQPSRLSEARRLLSDLRSAN